MALDKISRKQLSEPVRRPLYADEAAMIADQANQVEGWVYGYGDTRWEYLGTTAGTIADYREAGIYHAASDGKYYASKDGAWADFLPGDLNVRSSNTVLFDKNYLIGSSASPRSGNILFDFTGAKIGAVTFMWHLDASAFTIPSAQVKLYSVTQYSTSVANLFGFMLSDATASAEKVLTKLDRLNGY